MGKKISFFAVSSTGASIKQLTVSKAFLTSISILSFGCLLFVGYTLYDYFQVKKTFLDADDLKNKIYGHKEEIVNQRRQIQNFAQEIDTLKTRLLVLNDFERKIRIIANIERSAGKDSLFGVGGSTPEDLNTGIELTEKHNSLLREMHQQVDQLDFATANQNSGFESLLKYLEDQSNLLASTPAISPVKGWVTSKFGYRISPFTGKREFHKALDIGARKKSSIVATAKGVITYTGTKGLLGRIVIIDHGHGVVTRYGHIHKALKKRGETVKRGDKIALVGNTGRTTGSHVHYEVLLNGIPVNPMKYILD